MEYFIEICQLYAALIFRNELGLTFVQRSTKQHTMWLCHGMVCVNFNYFQPHMAHLGLTSVRRDWPANDFMNIFGSWVRGNIHSIMTLKFMMIIVCKEYWASSNGCIIILHVVFNELMIEKKKFSVVLASPCIYYCKPVSLF